MEKDELYINALNDINDVEENVYEDNYKIVKNIIVELPQSTNISKEVNETIWKKHNTDIPVIDFRIYNKKDKRYYKGISFTKKEAIEIVKKLTKYFNL